MVSFGPITFGGLVSGIDTDSLIKAIVQSRQFPVTNLQARIKDTQQLKLTLQLANSQFLALQKQSLNLRLEASFLSKTVAVSNPAVAKVVAGLNAPTSNSVLTVSRLAQGARATSGLGDRSLERGAALLVQGNTSGFNGVTVTQEKLTGTHALTTDLLTHTLQAGRGEAAITAGDTLTIAGTKKDGSAVNATFTFNGNATDTIQRLATAIQSAFGGDVTVGIGGNGQLVLSEANIAVPGDFTFSGLTFNDVDLSGSTFDLGLGPTQASGGPTTTQLTGTVTFTTGNSAVIADASTLLDDLDQVTNAPLNDGQEVININVILPDGTVSTTAYTYAAGDTLGDVLADINSLYAGTATASIENGRIVVTDAVAGESATALGLTFVNSGPTTNTFAIGSFIRTTAGAAETRQVAHTTVLEVPARGTWHIQTSNGLAGSLTGTVAVNPTDLLGSFAGLTQLNRFTIDRDTGAGGAAPLAVLGLTERSTVQDLLEAINTQVPAVTATLVDDGGGAFNLRLSANQGGTELRFTDVAGGILDTLFDPTVGVDTDFTTTNSTTLTTDVTALATFRPENGGPAQRVVISQAEGTALATLIPGLSLTGSGGNTFSPGSAIIRTVEDSELNQAPATRATVFGRVGIADPANTATPPLNIFKSLLTAGFAASIETSTTNAVDHVDGTFTINGKTITIASANQTVSEVLGLINASGAGVIATYDQTLDRIVLESATPGAGGITLGAAGDTSNFLRIAGLSEAGGGVAQSGNAKAGVVVNNNLSAAQFTIQPTSGTFTINGVSITVDVGADTLETLIAKINASPAGVTATYDANTDRLTLSQKLTNDTTANTITVGGPSDTSNILAALRLTDSPSISTTIGTSRQQAEFILDGVSYTRATNVVADIIPDTTITLQAVSAEPISIDISLDTAKALGILADFVKIYNETFEILNARPLTDDERDRTKELTDSERNTMTFSEIDAYENDREVLLTRDLIYKDQNIRRAIEKLRRDITTPVNGVAAAFDRLNAIGISTGTIGIGVNDAQLQKGFLVTDSTDRDTILEFLQGNTKLVDALANNPEDIQKLFGAPQESQAKVLGGQNINFGMSLTQRLSFSIGDNTGVGTVTFEPGNYTGAEIVNRIIEALGQANLSNTIAVKLNSAGRLEFTRSQTSGKALITIQDLNVGASLQSTLGLSSGSTFGVDATLAAGIGRRIESSLKEYTGLSGLINSQITTGGLLDKRINALAFELSEAEERFADYEARIRQQFVETERALARFQRDSQFLQARLSASGGSGNSGGLSLR